MSQEQPVETTLYSLSDAAPEPSDRRDGERHLTLFRVGSLMIDDRRELCLIKNISAGGMLIRAYCAIPVGTRISVELKRGEPLAGVAAWVRESTVGVRFDKPVDVVDLLKTSMDGPRPRMPRVEVQCLATIRDGSHVHQLQARDVSQGGLKVEDKALLMVGSDVMVSLPGLAPQAGAVRWRDGGSYGITFNRLLPLSELVGWLQEQRQQLRAAR